MNEKRINNSESSQQEYGRTIDDIEQGEIEGDFKEEENEEDNVKGEENRDVEVGSNDYQMDEEEEEGEENANLRDLEVGSNDFQTDNEEDIQVTWYSILSHKRLISLLSLIIGSFFGFMILPLLCFVLTKWEMAILYTCGAFFILAFPIFRVLKYRYRYFKEAILLCVYVALCLNMIGVSPFLVRIYKKFNEAHNFSDWKIDFQTSP